MTRNGIIRLIVTVGFMLWTLEALFFSAIPSGILWKIVAASIGATVGVAFFVTALIYRKK